MSFLLLGLGTNLGDRRENLRRAVKGLAERMTIVALSSLYETEPWGVTDQPSFLNMCLSAKVDERPEVLLPFIKELERSLGREKDIRWGPRLIDIDILFYNDVVMHTDSLDIPHRGVAERSFVLAPLAEIAPQFVHPVSGRTVAEMFDDVGNVGVKRLERPLYTAVELTHFTGE